MSGKSKCGSAWPFRDCCEQLRTQRSRRDFLKRAIGVQAEYANFGAVGGTDGKGCGGRRRPHGLAFPGEFGFIWGLALSFCGVCLLGRVGLIDGFWGSGFCLDGVCIHVWDSGLWPRVLSVCVGFFAFDVVCEGSVIAGETSLRDGARSRREVWELGAEVPDEVNRAPAWLVCRGARMWSTLWGLAATLSQRLSYSRFLPLFVPAASSGPHDL